MQRRALRVNPADNVIVALQPLAAGETVMVDNESYHITTNVSSKHKFAATALAKGDTVTMYGVTVGTAMVAIPQGAAISTENVRHAAAPPRLREREISWTPPSVTRWESVTFQGYHRANGSVGTANHWLVIPLVFCENRNLYLMKDALLRPLGYAHGSPYEAMVSQWARSYERGGAILIPENFADQEKRSRLFPNVDGVKFLAHTLGCGGTDGDSATLCGLLAGYIAHPNVAGATILSLGCQKAQYERLMAEVFQRDPGFCKPVHFFEQQKCASESVMLSQALKVTFESLAEANELRREPAPLSKLLLGVECGGSDGFSGISANPVIGAVADRLVSLNWSVILSEFPELCGVEQNIVDRCVSDEVARRFLDLMGAYQASAVRVGSGFDQNPSFGNIADGLITDAMKSAGAALKGGTSPVTSVLDYPEWATEPGLGLLCTPGNDVESTTAMAGSGANLMVFSTGLGTPTGNPVTPVVKISTSSEMAKRLPDLIDFDAGPVVSGDLTIDEAAEQLLELLVRSASGDYTPRAVQLGQDDFIPWKRGVSL